jgi:pimeloyl-ACP methyl ester carboxylesterase
MLREQPAPSPDGPGETTPLFLSSGLVHYSDILLGPAAQAQRDAIVESAYEIAPVLEQAWASFKRVDSDVRDPASSLKMPVFVAWARRDTLIRSSRNREAVECIPHVQVQLFDAGHAAFLETPEAFNEAAATFPSRLSRLAGVR